MATRNLIRFDWAMRLLRNKANYNVLEGFLSELLKQDIKIQSILESEGNQESVLAKFNRVDVLAADTKGELLIIEIQNQNEYDYFQRMIYGVSKVISEHTNFGEAFENTKKVHSVNIFYFDLGQGKDPVYHGKTEFRGIPQADYLQLSDKQKTMFGKAQPSEIFPEYYVPKVNQFNDVAKDSLDEWIYYLKNNDIKDDFTARGLDKAKVLLRFDNLEPDEQKQYKRHLENLSLQESLLK